MIDSSTTLTAEGELTRNSGTNAGATQFENQLNGLIPSVRFAIENQTSVVALQLWQRAPSLILLPFHLHLKWLERVESLSLNAKFGFAPYFGNDEAMITGPLSSYSIRDAAAAREKARRSRGQRQTNQVDDFQIPDWEQGYKKHSDELADLTLPGSSFLSVDVISPSSDIVRGNRSVLGRVSVRNAFRPALIVPSRLGVTTASAQTFAGIDLLIINLQGVRGRRASETIRKILAVRGPNRPTIIVASSPSDLIASDFNGVFESLPVFCIGKAPSIDEVGVVSVGENRHLEDRNFEFAVEELRGRSEPLDYLIDLAKSAWWASQQSLGDSDCGPELRRFENVLERMTSDATDDAGLLTMGKEIICRVAADSERASERRRAVSEAAITTSGESRILIVARGTGMRKLREEISTLLDLPVDSLSDLGVRLESPFSYSDFGAGPSGVAIVAGYFGLQTIDKVLTSRAKKICFVIDPIEARAAWYGTRKLIKCLRDMSVTEGVEALEKLASGIAEAIPAHLRSSALDVNVSPTWFDFSTVVRTTSHVMESCDVHSPDVVIFFADGTRLDVSENARFDLLGSMGSRLKTVTAIQLTPGDEIVLLNEDARDLFSEQLINALDKGILKAAAEQRQLWLMLVKLECATRDIKGQTIATRMAELGHPVTIAAVRSWMDFDENSEATVPNSRSRFLAFAKALEISVPEEGLMKMFDGIRRVRTGHRVAGRRLGRAIRAAYLNRLDASALSRIQREWGLDVVQLITSARVAIVDEIVLPRGITNHALA